MDSPELVSRSPAEAARYQRLRLWCGIVGIGLVLMLLWALCAFRADRLAGLMNDWPRVLSFATFAGGLALLVSVVQFPIDMFAMKVEYRFGQMLNQRLISQNYFSRAAQWVMGLTFAGGVLGAVVAWTPYWYLVAGVVLAVLGGVHIAYPILPSRRAHDKEIPDSNWQAQLKAEIVKLGLPVPGITWVEHGERSLVGGWHGIGSMRTLVLGRSLRQLEPVVAAMLVAREIGHSQMSHQFVSYLISVAWIVAGVFLAWLVTPASVLENHPAGLVLWLSAVMSTWCWLSLFVLPQWGRRQVLAADAFAASRSQSKDQSLAMLAALSECNLPDETLPPTVAWVFHPIPPMQQRRQAIEQLFSHSQEK
jgi:Zn-dependent protease with chaperone function